MAQLVQRHGGGHRHIERVGAVGPHRDPGAGVGRRGELRRQALALATEADDDRRPELQVDERGRRAAVQRQLRPGQRGKLRPGRQDGQRRIPCWPARPSANRGRRSPARAPPGRRRARARRAGWRRCCPGRPPRGGRRTDAPPRPGGLRLASAGDRRRSPGSRSPACSPRPATAARRPLPRPGAARARRRRPRPPPPGPRPRPRTGRCARARGGSGAFGSASASRCQGS